MLTLITRVFTILVVLLCFVVAPTFAEQTSPTTADNPAGIELKNMKRVGEMTTLGVVASAYIIGVDPVVNNNFTHRVVVNFVNEKSGVTVAKALVGIKHRKLFGATSDPVWMRSSDEQPALFVADVRLKKRGTYLFIVGSKLEDDKKRQFTFQYQH